MPRRGAAMPGSLRMGGPGRKPAMPPSPMGGVPPRPGAFGTPAIMGATQGPRAASGAGVRAFKKGGETVKKHEKGGAVEGVSKEEMHEHHKETARHHAKEKVSMHARGGPVIAGHTTHGLAGHEHPKEQGISKGSDGRRGGVKGAGLDPISSQTSNAKARVGHHAKGT